MRGRKSAVLPQRLVTPDAYKEGLNGPPGAAVCGDATGGRSDDGARVRGVLGADSPGLKPGSSISRPFPRPEGRGFYRRRALHDRFARRG